MAIRVEYELHARRRGRNIGVGLILVSLVTLMFGLTVVKALSLDDIRKMEAYDHAARPALTTGSDESGG